MRPSPADTGPERIVAARGSGGAGNRPFIVPPLAAQREPESGSEDAAGSGAAAWGAPCRAARHCAARYPRGNSRRSELLQECGGNHSQRSRAGALPCHGEGEHVKCNDLDGARQTCVEHPGASALLVRPSPHAGAGSARDAVRPALERAKKAWQRTRG